MLNVVARTAAVGAFAAGAVLGATGIAFAHPHGGGGDGDYMDNDIPPWAPPAAGPGTLAVCPSGNGCGPALPDVDGAHDGALIMGTRPAAVPPQSNEVAIESVTIAVEAIEPG